MREWWRPESLSAKRPNLERRGKIVKAVREFFAERDFVEVETPALQSCPGLEPHLQAFATTLCDPESGEKRTFYLHTSPELAMKKLLVSGLPRIWQMSRVFRNGEKGPAHHPEFTMLEWYRAGASYRDLMADCEALFALCQKASGATALTSRKGRADATAAWERLSVAEAFARFCGIDLLATAPDPLSPDFERLAEEAQRIGIRAHEGDDWEALFFRIFLERIEPHLGLGAPAILCDYPLFMAALAQRSPRDPRLAERFEVYACGVELANAFGELTDPVEQRARFLRDQARKRALYGEAYPIDEDFLAALECGLPPCAGIALGFDRLVMLLCAAERIEEVLWAPVL